MYQFLFSFNFGEVNLRCITLYFRTKVLESISTFNYNINVYHASNEKLYLTS